MSDVLDQAQNFSGGVVAAARKRESWLRRAANSTDEEQAAQYREAAADLAARYPDIEELEPGQAEGFAKERGHGRGSRSPVHGGRSRQRPGTTRRSSSKPTKQKAGGKPVPGLDPGAKRTSRAKPAPTPRVDRAIRQTGIPSSIESGGSTTMMLLGGTVSLSLLYLLINEKRDNKHLYTGPEGLAKVIKAISGFVGRFIAPEDFFPSNHPPHAASGSGGSGLAVNGVNAAVKGIRKAEAKHKQSQK